MAFEMGLEPQPTPREQKQRLTARLFRESAYWENLEARAKEDPNLTLSTETLLGLATYRQMRADAAALAQETEIPEVTAVVNTTIPPTDANAHEAVHRIEAGLIRQRLQALASIANVRPLTPEQLRERDEITVRLDQLVAVMAEEKRG